MLVAFPWLTIHHVSPEASLQGPMRTCPHGQDKYHHFQHHTLNFKKKKYYSHWRTGWPTFSWTIRTVTVQETTCSAELCDSSSVRWHGTSSAGLRVEICIASQCACDGCVSFLCACFKQKLCQCLHLRTVPQTPIRTGGMRLAVLETSLQVLMLPSTSSAPTREQNVEIPTFQECL